MVIRMVDLGQGISANSGLVANALHMTHGAEVVTLNATDVPRRVRKAVDQEQARFAHTPEPLVESWKLARYIASMSEAGDVLVLSDRGGVGGMLALVEASKPLGERLLVWTVAGDGVLLESLLVSGTADDADMSIASVVDWEIVQYRFSSKVFSTSGTATVLLNGIGVCAELSVAPFAPPKSSSDVRGGEGVWVPGPVSRANLSGDILRAVASSGDVPVVVSTEDAPDVVWSGTTWEALGAIRRVLGNRLSRADRSIARPASIVVGDPLSPPDDRTVAWRDEGVPILAARGSVAEAMWPEVETWETSDDLSALLQGNAASNATKIPELAVPPDVGREDEWRAQNVSVGVPVFRDVSYLDECVRSILNQSQPPAEILLIDDGSGSTAVDEALAGWAKREPGLVRVLSQPNRGVCVARNRMIDTMSGDAFLLVDQDDVLDPAFLQRTSEAMRQDESLWAVAVWTEFFGKYEGVEAKPPFDRRVGLRENPIVSTAALVDIRVRDEGIMFEPDLAFLFCEDWHYWSQIIVAGGRMGLVPEPLMRHRVHQASGGFQRTEVAHRIGKARATEPLLWRTPPVGNDQPSNSDLL